MKNSISMSLITLVTFAFFNNIYGVKGMPQKTVKQNLNFIVRDISKLETLHSKIGEKLTVLKSSLEDIKRQLEETKVEEEKGFSKREANKFGFKDESAKANKFSAKGKTAAKTGKSGSSRNIKVRRNEQDLL